jgi:hypothetical protein
MGWFDSITDFVRNAGEEFVENVKSAPYRAIDAIEELPHRVNDGLEKVRDTAGVVGSFFDSGSSERVVRSDEAEQTRRAQDAERQRRKEAAETSFLAFRNAQCEAFCADHGLPFDPAPLARTGVDDEAYLATLQALVAQRVAALSAQPDAERALELELEELLTRLRHLEAQRAIRKEVTR